MNEQPAHATAPEASGYDVEAIRRDFAILKREIHGHPLVYLDSAATSQRPEPVLQAMTDFYRQSNANVHRGVYTIAEEATKLYEGARQTLAGFLGVSDPDELVYVRGCTEAVNLVAHSFVEPRLKPGDEVLVTQMEHHSNIVPWQLICERKGARLVAAPINDKGELIVDDFERLLNERTRFVSVSHISNALGTINPVKKLVRLCQERGVPILLDGAQAVPHLPVDLSTLGADFYTVSGHKMLGPTGIGLLHGRREHLDAMPPWQGGGDMIREVSFGGTTYNDPPHRFEAGTPNVGGAIAMAEAARYLDRLGRARVHAHEERLREMATEGLLEIPGLRLVGEADSKAAVISFVIDGAHAQDVATLLDARGIAVRAGHHCAQPAMEFFGVSATVRVSFGPFNHEPDVQRLLEALLRVQRMLAA